MQILKSLVTLSFLFSQTNPRWRPSENLKMNLLVVVLCAFCHSWRLIRIQYCRDICHVCDVCDIRRGQNPQPIAADWARLSTVRIKMMSRTRRPRYNSRGQQHRRQDKNTTGQHRRMWTMLQVQQVVRCWYIKQCTRQQGSRSATAANLSRQFVIDSPVPEMRTGELENWRTRPCRVRFKLKDASQCGQNAFLRNAMLARAVQEVCRQIRMNTWKLN